ncbi:MAG: MFS transporter, partial [Rhodospirillales bacterium]
ITPAGGSGRVFGFVFVGLSVGSGLAGVVFGALVDAGLDLWVFPAVASLLALSVLITTVAQIAAQSS